MRHCYDGFNRPAKDKGQTTLTAKGLALLQKVLPEHYQRISRLMSNLDWTEQQNLVHTLEKLLQPR